MRTFLLLWLTQVTSQVGAGLTAFVLGVWAFKMGGGVDDFALTLLFAELPGVLLSPVAGALADRLPRKLALVASDFGAALGTATLAALLHYGALQLWHVYIVTCAVGILRAIQWPAFVAAAGELAPKEKSDQVAGLMQLGEAFALLLSPILGGIMLAWSSVASVLLLDLGAMIVANVTVLFLAIPSPQRAGNAWAWHDLSRDVGLGLRFLREKLELRRMLVWLMGMNFVTGLSVALVGPMLLTAADERMLGIVNTCGGAGLLLGGTLYAARGSRYQRGAVIAGGTLTSGLGFALVGLSGGGWIAAVGNFVATTAMSLVGAANQSIWLRTVPQELVGRVFAVRRMLTWSVIPIAYVTAEPIVRGFGRALEAAGRTDLGVAAPFALGFLALAGARLLLSAVALRRRLFAEAEPARAEADAA